MTQSHSSENWTLGFGLADCQLIIFPNKTKVVIWQFNKISRFLFQICETHVGLRVNFSFNFNESLYYQKQIACDCQLDPV